MAKAKTRTRIPLEVGQIVYVSYTEGWITTERKPELKEYTVTRFNGTSFYATSEPEEENPYEIKFTRREWIYNDRFSLGYYRAYENPETYWNMIHAKRLREDRVALINAKMKCANTQQLIDVMKALNLVDTEILKLEEKKSE